MQKQLKNVLTGGMDSDSDARAVAETDWRTSLNIRGGVAYAGKQGIITNVRGNEEIPYTLPAGSNKCIGAYQDIQANTILYFIWNSNGDCQILRYFADYNRIDLQVEYNFGWTADTNVTGIELINGKLLYWLDPQPRKINIEKARLIEPTAIATDKIKKWNVIVPKTVANMTSPYILTFKSRAGATLFISVGDVVGIPDREQVVSYLASLLNVSPSCPVIALACGQTLELTEKVANTVWTIECNQATLVVADNWYGAVMTDRMFDRGKWMPLYEPNPTYLQDDTVLYNYVRNKVFQFRLKYRYDDFENSALGVISQVPITNLQCDGTNAPEKNYIDVDFNDPAILEDTTLCILRDVTVLAREQNDGNWREIIQLPPVDFLDYDGTSWVASYNFYNNIVSNAVADAEVAKQYDDVPLTAEENLLVKNRSILANVVKGYDAPDCLPAKWSVDVVENNNNKLYTVSGKIRILTYGLDKGIQGSGHDNTFDEYFPNSAKYPFWKPPFSNNINHPPNIPGTGYGSELLRGGIFHDISRSTSNPTNDFPFFGGGSYNGANNSDFGIRDGMETDYDQRIPEGGFPVYAAGTQYLAISKQINVGLASDTLGALDTSSSTKISDIGNYLFSQSGAAFDLYSTFELKLPNGVYVIRLASHWCSFGVAGVDKLGKGFNYDLTNGTQYQKTSTNVWAVIDANGNQWKNEKELTITVNNGDVYIGEFIVADLAPPIRANITTGNNRDYWQPINAYLYDDFGRTDANSQTYFGIPVEKSLVFYGGYVWTGTLATPLPIVGITELGVIYSRACVSDHNGYWFGIGGQYVNPESPPKAAELSYNKWQISVLANTWIRRMDTVIATGTLSNLFNKDLSIINFDSGNSNGSDVSWGQGLVYGVVTTNSANSRDTSARVMEGYVKDLTTGYGIANVSAVYENGRNVVTQQDGFYQMIGWYDANSQNQGYYSHNQAIWIYSNAQGRADYLIFNAPSFCGVLYPNGQQLYVSIATSLYSIHKVNPDFIIDDSSDALGKAHKRGGQYTYGRRYYDDLGRFCSVVGAFSMYIPFITEDLNILCKQDNYNDPLQYPVGTYKYGKPTVNWFITSPAPAWATKYQWVRTKNSIYGRYLQWNVNQVTYLSAVATETTPEIETSYSNFDAVAVKVSLTNIVDYQSSNPESQVSYSFQSGDRLRITADRSLTYLSQLDDMNIVTYDEQTQSIIVKLKSNAVEIKSGFFVEIMNPKSITDPQEQIFYEVGEVYDVVNGQHTVTQGTFTNGDTYWRGRFIPVNDDATNYAAIYPVVVEDASVSDFYPSNSEDIGRAGVIDPNFKQIHFPTMMQNSNVYVEGSAINGLSSFESYNYKELNRAFGGIKRLFYVGNTLLSIHENKVVANYIELRSLSDANNTDGLLAVSNAYFGNDRPMQSEYGCQHPNSAVQYNGFVYFLDASKGVICRTDNNGLNSISDIKMRSYFRKLCAEGVTDAIGVFDPYYREYVVTIKTQKVVQQNPLIFNEKTVAWGEDKNRWSTFYSFIPERYASVLRSIVSFVDGKFYLHDVSNTYNNFYGTQHRTELTVIPHTDDTKQTFHTVLLQGVQATPLKNDWGIENIENDYGQKSRLKKQHFRLKENFWCASFLRDLTDTTVVDPIINGRNLRGQELTCEFINDATELVSLQQIIVNITPSERSPK